MQPHARFSATEADWTFVSVKCPCRICGSHKGCRTGFDGQFACCTRISSQWPLSVGGWVHRFDADAAVTPALARGKSEWSAEGASAAPPSP